MAHRLDDRSAERPETLEVQIDGRIPISQPPVREAALPKEPVSDPSGISRSEVRG